MQIGIIGLGRTGATIGRRIARAGHGVVGLDESESARLAFSSIGRAVVRIDELLAILPQPRTVLLMLPRGAPTEATIAALASACEPGDVVIDGGHSDFRSATETAAKLASVGIDFIDLGLSAGRSALDLGYCLMVGGSQEAVARVEPMLRDLAAPGGYAHVGPVGAGHYLKSIHSTIACSLMEAYREALETMTNDRAFDFDLAQIDRIWRCGSLVDSWSLELIAEALQPKVDLAQAERRARVLELRDHFVSTRTSG